MFRKYGKSAKPLLGHKTQFFETNDEIREKLLAIGRTYAEQPRRSSCKNCGQRLPDPTFVKHGVAYAICDRCGHLNGCHEDTSDFCATVYTNEDGKAYAQNYSAENRASYFQRVRDIYVPKADFLRDALAEAGTSPGALRYADLGAGSGYFVAALLEQGFQNVAGFEVSETQVALANVMTDGTHVTAHELDEAVTIARTVEADVITMIGVLEHLQHPREVLKAIRENPAVEYFFISVPLFSPTVFLEMVFPEVMPRQLAAGHTHLYTEQSLEWMAQEHGLERIAEWWFGTDMVDLYRNVAVMLGKSENTRSVANSWRDHMLPVVDGMQLALDEKHLSSEVHMLFRKHRRG